MATIRGDAAEAALFVRVAAMLRERGLESDAHLVAFLTAVPIDTDRDAERLLQHISETGAWVLMESAIADLPADLRWLFESGAVTLEQLASLHHALGATSAFDLATAVQQQAIRLVPSLDATIEYAVGAALFDLRAATPRIPLGRAVAIANPLMEWLRSRTDIGLVSSAGSLRRGQETVGDIEIVAAASDSAAAIDELSRYPGIIRVLHRSARRLYVLLERAQVGIRFVQPSDAGATLLHLTGSAAHLEALRTLAGERGCQLRPEGLSDSRGVSPPCGDTEEAIYAALDLPMIPPEIRDGGDEIEAARNGRLPTLVSLGDIRGDLHMHSIWSDGADSIETIVRACRALGYRYLAITDHSPRSLAVRTLSPDDLGRQADEIAGLRERYPDISILHGCEVEILPDGNLDLPDRVLERLDLVVVSLHERAGQSREQLLKRYLRAMRHPLVTLIAHPTNRLVPQKPGYDLDYDRLFSTAADTSTFVEIDGSPTHLDLDGTLARRAAAAGALLAINSDSHRAEMLRFQMELGITTGRRGWIQPRHVVNTLPTDALRALLARKRSAGRPR